MYTDPEQQSSPDESLSGAYTNPAGSGRPAPDTDQAMADPEGIEDRHDHLADIRTADDRLADAAGSAVETALTDGPEPKPSGNAAHDVPAESSDTAEPSDTAGSSDTAESSDTVGSSDTAGPAGPAGTAVPAFLPPPSSSRPEGSAVSASRPQTRLLAGVVVACLILSVLSGFAGGYLASRTVPAPAATTASTTGSRATIATTSSATGTSTTSTTSTAGGTTAPSGSGQSGSLNVTAVAQTASPSVVVILTETLARGQNIQQYVTSGAGSGVILTADGLIVTNEHVISGAQRIIVQLADNRTFTATLAGSDVKSDLAILRIAVTGLTPARLGDSSRLSVGDPVVAIGNPLGELGGTVTNGIISALDRPITLDNETKNLLQTNAAVNPGNSGGGLFDRNGSLIGIVEAKTSAVGIEGIAFAIPINTARPVIDELANYGYVRGRVSLGMSLLDVDTQQKMRIYRLPQLGVYVVQTTGGSAAAAGFKSGDCLLSVDGTAVTTGAQVVDVVGKHAVGDKVTVVILRDGKQQTLEMTLLEDKPATAG